KAAVKFAKDAILPWLGSRIDWHLLKIKRIKEVVNCFTLSICPWTITKIGAFPRLDFNTPSRPLLCYFIVFAGWLPCTCSVFHNAWLILVVIEFNKITLKDNKSFTHKAWWILSLTSIIWTVGQNY